MQTEKPHIWTRPLFFLITLPVFYFLHQVNEHYAAGLLAPMALLILLYSAAGLLLTFLFRLWLKDTAKAALFSTGLISFNFFFGYLHDWSKQRFGPQAWINKYSVIIFLLVLLSLTALYLLKKSRARTGRLVVFLNLLFPVLIAYETFVLWQHSRQQAAVAHPFTWRPCANCERPDIYLIIADEYAGSGVLKDLFGFDNSAFEQALGARGFHVLQNTRSNYNATVYSMASLFSMDYLSLNGKGRVTQGDMLYCRNIIDKNPLLGFLQQQGYQVVNNSFFDLQGHTKTLTNYYFHPKTRILSFGTFINRLRIHASFNFFSKAKADRIRKNDFYNDEKADSLLRQLAVQQPAAPRFIYTHFTRPHHPYYVDSKGRPFLPTDTVKGFDLTRKMYTEHLRYTNTRLLQLIDHILQHAAKKPIILLASDHGFRQFDTPVNPDYYFRNLSAVLLPGGDYRQFRDGLSPVNTFRAILNSAFGQQLPLLPDSSIFLTEKASW